MKTRPRAGGRPAELRSLLSPVPTGGQPPDDGETVQGEPCPTCGRGLVLTEREHLALVRLAGGSTIAAIGTHLGLAPTTVQVALGRARRRAGARTLTHLAAIGVRTGLIPLHVPRHHPGPLTARRREVLALFAEGLTIGQIAAALGITPNTIKTSRTIVYRHLGVTTLPAAVTMLLSLDELDRRPHCTTAACVAAHQKQTRASTPTDARTEALHWANTLAAAATERLEHQRLHHQLTHATAQLAQSRADMEAMLQQVQQAGQEVSTAHRMWAETAELRRQVRDLHDAVRPAADEAKEALRLAESTRAAVAETLQSAGALERAYERLEARRKQLDAVDQAVVDRPPAVGPPVRGPVREAIPPEQRPWRRP
ncbi:LuxR C-terminal-related transcriptional regulator [Kitasatospora sp. NPDC004745]|uniref:helix-turn-helix transcriptional regulator n=1 Tax=Kitasatospora sp. NPDC004745 TaxID=3364019 RepID=UPI00367F212C